MPQSRARPTSIRALVPGLAARKLVVELPGLRAHLFLRELHEAGLLLQRCLRLGRGLLRVLVDAEQVDLERAVGQVRVAVALLDRDVARNVQLRAEIRNVAPGELGGRTLGRLQRLRRSDGDSWSWDPRRFTRARNVAVAYAKCPASSCASA
jgi:hypothetical protein